MLKLNKKIIILVLIFTMLSSYFVSAEIIELDVSFNSTITGDVQKIEIIPILEGGYATNASIIIEDLDCTHNYGPICGNKQNFFVKILNWFKKLF